MRKRTRERLIDLCYQDGYTTWDQARVPVDAHGRYDQHEASRWEEAHGHDIRTKCYPEFGCELLVDPADILTLLEEDHDDE